MNRCWLNTIGVALHRGSGGSTPSLEERSTVCRRGRHATVVLFVIASVVPMANAAEVSSARHKVLAADRNRLAQFAADGTLEWTFDDLRQVHCIQQLDNGHILVQQGWGKIIELDRERNVVWSYDAASSNGNAGKRLEVHAFQRLPDGNTMLVENGRGRIIEIDPHGQLVHSLAYQVSQPDAHRDVRRAHKLSTGNYLVCHEADGRVVEYDPRGNIVWKYNVPLFGQSPRPGHGPEAWGNQVFNALRLPDGNTLIATGNGHSVLEVSPAGEIVWEVHRNELPGITLAWTTSLELLPGGNIIVGNCHAGENQPQLIEITRSKEVVWTFRDFETLGDSTAASATADGIEGIVR